MDAAIPGTVPFRFMCAAPWVVSSSFFSTVVGFLFLTSSREVRTASFFVIVVGHSTAHGGGGRGRGRGSIRIVVAVVHRGPGAIVSRVTRARGIAMRSRVCGMCLFFVSAIRDFVAIHRVARSWRLDGPAVAIRHCRLRRRVLVGGISAIRHAHVRKARCFSYRKR